MAWNDWIRTVEIEPSLTTADPIAVAAQVEVLLRSGCRVFHLDVDGEDGLALFERIAPLVHRFEGVLDVHLTGGASMGDVLPLRPDSLTVEPANAIRGHGVQLGVVFPADEDPSWEPPDVDLVSIAVEDSEASVERVRAIASALPSRVRVQVEGDLAWDSVRPFYEAGATLLVVGQSIFEREDLPRAYRRLVQALA